MAGLKGFYFSLDALTASTVMIAIAGLLFAYNPSLATEPQKIDSLHISAKQDYDDWNQSSQKQGKVLTEIYRRYYSGDHSSASKLCQNYFKQKSFTLYFENNTHRDKICGNLTTQKKQSLITSQTPIADVKINKSFIGPKTAVMAVVQD